MGERCQRLEEHRQDLGESMRGRQALDAMHREFGYPGEARADSWGHIYDSGGLGIGLTPGAEAAYTGRMGGPAAARALLTRSGLAHRIVWGPVLDALARGWSTDTDGTTKEGADKGLDLTRDLDQRLGLLEAMRDALASARADGGSWLWLAAKGADYSKPRPPGTPTDRVQVLGANEVEVQTLDADPASQTFGKASETVTVQLVRQGMTISLSNPTVHTSWLVYVPGAPTLPGARPMKTGYGQSILELYIRAIGNLDGTGYSVSRLLDRLSMPWVRLAAGAAMTSGDEEGELNARMKMLNDAMTAAGLLMLIGDDEAGWSGPSLGGVRESVTLLYEALTVPEGIPLSKLFGQAPGGLSTDDKSGQRTYNAFMASLRTFSVNPVLLEVYDRILGPDPARRISWPDMHPLDAIEEAQVSLARAQRDATLVGLGALFPDEVRSRFLGNEEAALPEVEDLPDMPPPIDESAPSVLSPPAPQPVPPSGSGATSPQPAGGEAGSTGGASS